MHEAEFAGGLGRDIDPGHALPDDPVVFGGFQADGLVGGRQRQPRVLAAHQLAVVQLTRVAVVPGPDHAVAHP
ncbi:hypothetical protein G6F62_014778 [Rhizopus arrhizus]|nr:hypothetical protein G6F22_019358 [Rhizopus arrhizus]KAG1240572.1 hypothetical protein G6F68_017530 [Rhizopus microsporus]KAG1309649.1 hypothetical protein G6F62_014778 [Rhizopus arrhizus]KAG1313723.1 hypothetical protein G6F63_016196 [Rhizopus arrhizus]